MTDKIKALRAARDSWENSASNRNDLLAHLLATIDDLLSDQPAQGTVRIEFPVHDDGDGKMFVSIYRDAAGIVYDSAGGCPIIATVVADIPLSVVPVVVGRVK